MGPTSCTATTATERSPTSPQVGVRVEMASVSVPDVTFSIWTATAILDLYVANYFKFTFAQHVATDDIGGFAIYGSPIDYEAEPDTLYRNNGDGTFTDVSEALGNRGRTRERHGMVCADYDDDGDTDVFVRQRRGSQLPVPRTTAAGSSKRSGLLGGFAYDRTGRMQGSMGVDCGDYNNDGRLDFFTTSYQNELASLYANLVSGLLEDVTLRSAGTGTALPQSLGETVSSTSTTTAIATCSSLAGTCTIESLEFDRRQLQGAEICCSRNLGSGKLP